MPALSVIISLSGPGKILGPASSRANTPQTIVALLFFISSYSYPLGLRPLGYKRHHHHHHYIIITITISSSPSLSSTHARGQPSTSPYSCSWPLASRFPNKAHPQSKYDSTVDSVQDPKINPKCSSHTTTRRCTRSISSSSSSTRRGEI